MNDNSKKIAISNIFDSIYAKIGISVYTVIISAVVSYFTSKVFYEMLWPNERFTVCAFMTVSMLLAYSVMIYRLNGLKAIILFHFVLIATPLSLVLPYEFRLYPAIILIVALFSDFYVALISCVGICAYSFVTMASEPEFFFTIITLICGTCSLAVAKKYKNYIFKAIAIIVVVLINGGLHLVFKSYCKETYLEYDNAAFIFKCMAGMLIALLIYVLIEVLYYKFILKKSFRRDFLKMREHNYKPRSFMKSKSDKLYDHCMQVAVLSEVAAKAIGADEDICYIGGMFHDVGKMFGNDYIKEGVKFAYKYDFPQEIIDVIGSHSGKEMIPKTKEEGIVLLADTVSSSISYLQNKGETISVSKIVDNAIMNRISKGVLNNSNLTITDIYKIQDIFVNEMEK